MPADAARLTLFPAHNEVVPEGVIVATGLADTLTLVAGETDEHPDALVTLTVYDPELVMFTEAVVCPPGDHKYDAPLLEVKFTLLPVQKVNGPLADIVAEGFAYTVTVRGLEVAEHPPAFVTLTE